MHCSVNVNDLKQVTDEFDHIMENIKHYITKEPVHVSHKVEAGWQQNHVGIRLSVEPQILTNKSKMRYSSMCQLSSLH